MPSGVLLGLALRCGVSVDIALSDSVWGVVIDDVDSIDGLHEGCLSVHGKAAALALRHGIVTTFPEVSRISLSLSPTESFISI